jgi:hypothetical protein
MRLGLSIARHLVEMHDGTVEAESAGVDKGASFGFSYRCSLATLSCRLRTCGFETFKRRRGMFLRLFAAVSLIVFSGAAFAHSCPVLMSEIDETLNEPATEQRLNAEQLSKVRQLRKEGEQAHLAGEHAKSMELLSRAKGTLEKP